MEKVGPVMKHSFLLSAGVWTVQGTYYDHDRQAFPATGRIEITHKKKLWHYKGRITLAGVGQGDRALVPDADGSTGGGNAAPDQDADGRTHGGENAAFGPDADGGTPEHSPEQGDEPQTPVSDDTSDVLAAKPVEIRSNYEIAPFTGDVTAWQSEDAKLGTLIGQFAVVEDTIISLYSATSGEYFGSESWKQISRSEYRGRGVLYGVGGKIYSWAVRLEKLV